jgi:hypothetical protein
MSINYTCKRCGLLTTNNYNDFKKHLNRKSPCKKKYDSIFFSDDQLLVMSLIPNYEKNKSLNEIEHLNNSNILDKNKIELFNELNNIEKSKIKECKYCNENFLFIVDLKQHLITSCFFNELLKRNNNLIKSPKNTIINNIENKNIIYLIPFDNNWDISNISNEKKSYLITSKLMYTSLLDEILKNKNNLNVIIDKNKETGMIYKNDIEKYIQMKLKDIIVKTMEKLNLLLIEINKVDCLIFDEIKDFSRKMINKKYIDYQKDENIQTNVENLFSTLYENKKTEAIEIAKSVNNDNGY